MGLYREEYCPSPFDDKDEPQEKRTNMQSIQGRADYLNSRVTSFGTMYNIKLGGVEYSTGKDDPAAKYGIAQGDIVSFSAEQNAKGYWNIKGPVTKQSAQAASAAPAAVGGGRSYADSNDAKQRSITRQASRNTAVAFLKLAQEAGVLPAAKNKGAGFDVLREMLDKITDEFYNDSLNPQAFEGSAEGGATAAAKSDGEWQE
jgi:hypothetical protein